MSAKITTPFGHAVPPAPRHAVTVHIGAEWKNAVTFATDPPAMLAQLKDYYPRAKPHRDIVKFSASVLDHIGASEKACLLFPSLESAKQCVDYAISSKRDDGDKKPLIREELSIRAFAAKDPFFTVIFPAEKYRVVAGFWSTVGLGISSRFAEANLDQINQLKEISFEEAETKRTCFEGPAHDTLRQRILTLLRRAPLHPDQPLKMATSDIYLFPSGMATIYKPHSYMLKRQPGPSVLFGVAFMDTLVTLEQFGPESKFFGLGTDDDIHALDVYLQEQKDQGKQVQAIWAEFPANPLLGSPDILALRRLATKYNVVLGIDDTIGSWANIDVIGIADILVTSITKSFNGYADAIGGSAILNPSSPKYSQLKAMFDEDYVPEFYEDDAKAMEKNSRDYLERTTVFNRNALALVGYLDTKAKDPESAVRQVFYPSVNPTGDNYKQFMRPPTKDFTPGYGCLFSVELDDLDATKAFYENLNIHKSVHLGAPRTMAFAYTLCAYYKKLEWAAQFGLRPTQIRVSVGLEDKDMLLEEFRIAVEAADRVKKQKAK